MKICAKVTIFPATLRHDSRGEEKAVRDTSDLVKGNMISRYNLIRWGFTP